MSERLLNLLDQINAKKAEVKNLVEAGNLDEAEAAKNELKNLQREFDLLKDLEDEEIENAQNRADMEIWHRFTMKRIVWQNLRMQPDMDFGSQMH